VDGRSFVPLLGSTLPPAGAWRRAFMVEHYTSPDNADEDSMGGPAVPRPRAVPELHALRAGDYVYIEYVTGDRELYDLRADPFELRNVAGTVDPALLRQLAARLATVRRCRGAACRPAEDAAVPAITTR
jgi:hypothetical protein